MPFGLPVVPELYGIIAPTGCSANGFVVNRETASSKSS